MSDQASALLAFTAAVLVCLTLYLMRHFVALGRRFTASIAAITITCIALSIFIYNQTESEYRASINDYKED